MKGFYDIEGTEICQGDEILITVNFGRSSSHLKRGRVTGFTPSFMKYDINEGYSWHEKIKNDNCSFRVLVMKGEFKKYRKDELLPGS